MLANLRKSRKQEGLTQRELSKLIGISDSYYSQLENGTRRMSLSVARKIALVLDQSMDALFMPPDFTYCNNKDGQIKDQAKQKGIV